MFYQSEAARWKNRRMWWRWRWVDKQTDRWREEWANKRESATDGGSESSKSKQDRGCLELPVWTDGRLCANYKPSAWHCKHNQRGNWLYLFSFTLTEPCTQKTILSYTLSTNRFIDTTKMHGHTWSEGNLRILHLNQYIVCFIIYIRNPPLYLYHWFLIFIANDPVIIVFCTLQ